MPYPLPSLARSLWLLTLLLAGAARAQPVDTSSLESAYARLVSFEAQPEISAARITVESDDPGASDIDIETVKLPFYREFDLEGGERRWFIQATGSYLNMEETLTIPIIGDLTERMDFQWKGYGALVEGGLVLHLSETLDLVPSLGFGITRLESKVGFSGSLLEDLLSPALDGVLYNWDTLAGIARISTALRYDQDFGRWRLKGSAHLSGSHIDSFDESRRFPGFRDEAANMGLMLDASHPTGWEVRDHTVYLIGHLGFTQFLGAESDDLGFDNFGEAGVSLGVQKLTLGVLGVWGSDVTGWNLILNYDY